MKQRRLQRFIRENSHQLDEDASFSALSAGWSTAVAILPILACCLRQANQPLTLTLTYQLFLTSLLVFGFVWLLTLLTGIGRYLSTQTFWEYLCSLKPVPATHWTRPVHVEEAERILAITRFRQLRQLCAQHSLPHLSKSKAPLLLFQQAPLLLAP